MQPKGQNYLIESIGTVFICALSEKKVNLKHEKVCEKVGSEPFWKWLQQKASEADHKSPRKKSAPRGIWWARAENNSKVSLQRQDLIQGLLTMVFEDFVLHV